MHSMQNQAIKILCEEVLTEVIGTWHVWILFGIETLFTMRVKFSAPPEIWPVQETHSGKGATKGDLFKKPLRNSGAELTEIWRPR